MYEIRIKIKDTRSLLEKFKNFPHPQIQFYLWLTRKLEPTEKYILLNQLKQTKQMGSIQNNIVTDLRAIRSTDGDYLSFNVPYSELKSAHLTALFQRYSFITLSLTLEQTKKHIGYKINNDYLVTYFKDLSDIILLFEARNT